MCVRDVWCPPPLSLPGLKLPTTTASATAWYHYNIMRTTRIMATEWSGYPAPVVHWLLIQRIPLSSSHTHKSSVQCPPGQTKGTGLFSFYWKRRAPDFRFIGIFMVFASWSNRVGRVVIGTGYVSGCRHHHRLLILLMSIYVLVAKPHINSVKHNYNREEGR